MIERLRDGAPSTGAVFALAAVALWSTNALAAKLALAELGVVQVLALQFGGAAATLAMLRIARLARASKSGEDTQRPTLRSLETLGGVAIGVIGLAGTISLQYLAFATAPIVEANVVAYGWPLFAVLWAAVAYRSRQTLVGVPLAMVGFAGVALILGSGGGFAGSGGGNAGYAAALASAVCMASYTVASDSSRVPADASLLLAAAFGSVFAVALCVAGLAPWAWSAVPGAWAASVYAGVGPMAGGFLLWSLAMSGGGATRLAPLGYATPLLSTALLLLFGETLAPGASLGAALVLICSIGVLIVDRKEHG